MRAPPPRPSRARKRRAPPPPPPPKAKVEEAPKGSIRDVWTPCLVRWDGKWIKSFLDGDGYLVVSYVDMTRQPQTINAKRAKELSRVLTYRAGPYYTVWIADENAAYHQVWGGDIVIGTVKGAGKGAIFAPGVEPLYTAPHKVVPPPPPSRVVTEPSRTMKGAIPPRPPPPRKRKRKRPPPPPTPLLGP